MRLSIFKLGKAVVKRPRLQEQIAVVYPGARRYALHERVQAVPLAALVDGMKGLFP